MWADYRVSAYSNPGYDKENKNKYQVNPTRRLPANVSKHCIIQFFENMVPDSTLDVFSPAKNKTVII
jgi:hypothetical protein